MTMPFANFQLPIKISVNFTSKNLFSAKFDPSPPKVYCSTRRPSSSSSKTSLAVELGPDKLEADNSSSSEPRWKSVAKRKVAMRVGYVGTNYRGLQIQRVSSSMITIEDELEKAIFKAGGMLESNYGDLHKIGWRRSSRTDKGVHSLATVIALKMEVPADAWVEDPDGVALADVINRYLPYTIRVFSILPVNKSFDARTDCLSRKYVYLLPAEVIGIDNNSSPKEIECHIKEFRDILQMFEGSHPFHNYTIRANYRKHSLKALVRISRPNSSVGKGLHLESKEHKRNYGSFNNLEKEILNLTDTSDVEEDVMTSIQDNKFGSNMSSAPEVSKHPRAKWLYEPDEADRLSAAHFRKIISCTCGGLETIKSARYIEISIHGASFMVHQIRKMVGTAVAVKRVLLPQDTIKISLARFSRFVLPLAPSEVLVLSGNKFYFSDKFLSQSVSSNILYGRSELSRLTGSTTIQGIVNDFYSAVLLPDLENFLDPSKPLWKEWLENLEQCCIPDVEMNELRRAWTQWQENHIPRKQEESQEI